MRTPLTPEQRGELQELYDRVSLTLRYMESVEPSDLGAMLQARVREVFEAEDIRGMRRVARDIDQATVGLSQHHLDGLNAVLKQRLSVDRDAELKAWKERVDRALRRGSIASEKERQHLQEYVEKLEASGGDAAEVSAIWNLIRSG